MPMNLFCSDLYGRIVAQIDELGMNKAQNDYEHSFKKEKRSVIHSVFLIPDAP
jgi:hypothetical protein